MTQDTLQTIITGAGGTAGVAVAGYVAEATITIDDVQHVCALLMQIVIGVLTIYRLIKDKKK
jgi:hypothetical protein